MRMNRRTTIFGVAVLVAAISLAGCSSAAPATITGSNNSADLAAASSPAHGGNTNILIYSINSDGPNFRSVVTGKIGDYGPARTILPNGKADPSHSSQIELELTRGSFRLDIAALDKAFVQAASREPVYPRTCSDFASVTTAAAIVSGSGTGSYQGISGSLQLTATLDEAEATSCRPGSPANFRWQVISMAGSGTVSP